jgi:glutamate--cysteine ligase
MLAISTAGLEARAKALDIKSEKGFLEPLQEIVDRGQTRAEELLALYRGEWKGDLCRLFDAYNFL